MRLDEGVKPTWREPDVGDDVLAMVEGHQILQGVCVDDQEAAVVQAHSQGLAVGGEATTAPPWGQEELLLACRRANRRAPQ